MKEMIIQKITDPKDLDVLRNKKADFGELIFNFSDSYINQLKKMLLKDSSLQLVARKEKVFAGYIASIVSERWLKHIEILELFIDPNFQGKGVGTKLVNEVINYARGLSFDGVIVQTEKENIPAQKLYEKLGFIVIDNPEWQEGITYQLSLD